MARSECPGAASSAVEKIERSTTPWRLKERVHPSGAGHIHGTDRGRVSTCARRTCPVSFHRGPSIPAVAEHQTRRTCAFHGPRRWAISEPSFIHGRHFCERLFSGDRCRYGIPTSTWACPFKRSHKPPCSTPRTFSTTCSIRKLAWSLGFILRVFLAGLLTVLVIRELGGNRIGALLAGIAFAFSGW